MESQLSANYLERKELLATVEVPKMFEAKLTVGSPLASVIFEECHPDLRELFGLEPPLEGPKGELWQSPSDLLIGKVALKPPLTQKHIRALTHQGILDLGAEVEQKFRNEMRLEAERTLREREDFLNKVHEAGKAALVGRTREEERIRHEQQIERLRHDFDNKVCQLLWECHEQVRQLEEQLQIEFDGLNVLWEEKLEQEISETVNRITQEFLEKMRRQEHTLVKIFKNQITALKIKSKYNLEFQRMKYKEMFAQLKHKLHCQNVTNLIYLLCKERRKCKSEKNDLKNNYLERIRKHVSNVKKKNRIIKNLRNIRDKKIKQLNTRERCLIEILRQFQKFIYFALKAAPTQGEFLLNIDKLIKFEIEDFCIPEREVPKQIEEIKEFSVIEPVQEDSTELDKYLQDSKLLTNEEEAYSDILPALYFNDKIYVREDFRDMLSAGIRIDRGHSLWNPDVEELLNIFRKNISSKSTHQSVDKVKSYHSTVHFHSDQTNGSFDDNSTVCNQIINVVPDSPSQGSAQSGLNPQSTLQKVETVMSKISPTSSKSAHSKNTSSEEQTADKGMRRVSLSPPSIKKYVSGGLQESSRTITRHRSEDDDDLKAKPMMRGTSMTQSKLTLARDSIILHISNVERKSLQYMSKMSDQVSVSKSMEDEEQEERVVTEKTDTESDTSEIQSQKSIDNQESRATSRLLLATDSYEIIKRSTMGLVDRSKLPASAESAKPQSAKTTAGKKFEKKSQQVKKKTTPKKRITAGSPQSTAEVVGSRKTEDHEKSTDEFTDERIRSLVHIMKENPSLIRLFTPCL